jgi:epoxide hydrolase 4
MVMARRAHRIYLRHFLANWPRQKDAFLPYLEEWVDNFLHPGNLQGFDWYIGVDRFRARIIHGGGSRY